MSGCYIYEGGAMVPEEECNRITAQKTAAIDAGLPPPLLLDHPSVANLAPEVRQAIIKRYEEDNPPNLTLYYIAGGLVALLIIRKFIF
jgi:hypothetical protein